jgi:hypothetical protein
MPTAEEWIAAYADKLGAAVPAASEVDAILALAGVAAHASERKAAPVACWVAAQAGVDLERAMAVAEELA